MSKILREVRSDGHLLGYSFRCPGCGEDDKRVGTHWIRCDGEGMSWGFNGSLDAPTFSPSLLNSWNEGEARTPMRCHLFVTDGKIVYCSDCTHELAGQTVAMVPFEDEPA